MQVREELEKLLKIQEFDIRSREASRVLKLAPLILKPLQEEIEKLTIRIAEIQEKQEHFAKKILDLENAVKSDAIYADTMEAKLPSLISNHKEYHMTAKTIDKLRKLGRDRLVEIAKLRESAVAEHGRFEEKTALLQEKTAELKAKQSEVETQIQDAQEELSKARSEKEKSLGEVVPTVLSKYQRLTTAYGHGIGVVRDKRCVSCDVTIPSQTYNLLLRGEEFLHCPNCQRLLFLQ